MLLSSTFLFFLGLQFSLFVSGDTGTTPSMFQSHLPIGATLVQ